MLGCVCSTQVSSANPPPPPPPLLPRGKKDIFFIVQHPPQWAKFLKLQIPIDTLIFNIPFVRKCPLNTGIIFYEIHGCLVHLVLD